MSISTNAFSLSVFTSSTVTGISTILVGYQSPPPPINFITVTIGYYVNQAIEHKIFTGEFVNLSFLLARDPTNLQTISTLAIR